MSEMGPYTAPGKNGGFVSLNEDGEWMRVTWKNKSDTYETVIAVPLDLVARFSVKTFHLVSLNARDSEEVLR